MPFLGVYTNLDRYGDEVRITFQPQTSTDIDASFQAINVQMEDMCGPEEPEKMSSHPVFGPHPNHHSPDYNIGEAPWTKNNSPDS